MHRSADASTSYQRQSSAMTSEEVQHVRWAGWAILLTITLAWASWVSILSLNSSTAITTHAERIDLHYQQLKGELTEIKGDVKQLLRNSKAGGGE